MDIVVPAGSVYGLVGPNGPGKTTLLAILAGLRRPTSGAVRVPMDRQRVATLPDTPAFEPWLTGCEVVDLARALVAPELPRACRAMATRISAFGSEVRCSRPTWTVTASRPP